MQDIPYADIVILALIAGFILLRLRNVLGQKTGFELPPEQLHTPAQDDAPVVQLADKLAKMRGEAQKQEADEMELITDAPVKAVLQEIKKADNAFSVRHFMEGAKGAFEMVFSAFHQGDIDTLKMLLSPALYASFAQALEERKSADAYKDTTLVAIEVAELTDASLEKNTAKITVRFVSEQISVMRNQSKAIVEGDPTRTERVEDVWVFERNTNARTPNWTIIDT